MARTTELTLVVCLHVTVLTGCGRVAEPLTAKDEAHAVRLSQQEEISVMVAVLSHIADNNESVLGANAAAWCVAYADDGRARSSYRDPPSVLIEYLGAQDQRFARYSQCDVGELDPNRTTLILYVQPALQARDSGRVVVLGGYFESSLSASGHRYELERLQGGEWVVVEDSLLWIS